MSKKKNLPAMPLYIGDWKKDPAVCAMTVEDEGIYLRLIMVCWESEQRGYLQINGKPYPIDLLANVINLDNQRLTKWLTTYQDIFNIFGTTEDNILYSRKQIDILELSDKRRMAGKQGGNPNLLNQELTKGLARGKALPITANETVIVNENVIKNINKDINKIDFENFWNLYDKKTGRPSCEKKWNKLSLEEQKQAMEFIPKYKRAQPDKQFRKNPEAFINQKGWNDEIIKGRTPRGTVDFDAISEEIKKYS